MGECVLLPLVEWAESLCSEVAFTGLRIAVSLLGENKLVQSAGDL